MLMSKLPLIIIVAHESCIVNIQIGVENSNMGSLTTPYLQVLKGSRDLILLFWDPLHISGTVQARNVIFSNRIDHEGR